MPFLLLCGMGFSAFFAGVGTFVLTLMVPIMVFGNGPFTSNGVEVDKATFLRDAAPTFLIMPLFLALYGAVAYGLWKERPWTRTVMAGCWVALVVASILATFLVPSEDSDAVISVTSMVLMTGFAAWYLYGKGSVIAYYRAIEEQDARRRAALAGILREPVAPSPPVS